MLSGFLAFLGAIPGIGAIITAITSKVFDSKVAIATAKIGGDRDIAVATVKAAEVAEQAHASNVAAIAANRLLTWLVIVFATPFVIFIWKVVVWDIVFQLGTTDPIKGQVADWANTIIGFIFGSATVSTVSRMVLGWLDKRAP